VSKNSIFLLTRHGPRTQPPHEKWLQPVLRQHDGTAQGPRSLHFPPKAAVYPSRVKLPLPTVGRLSSCFVFISQFVAEALAFAIL